MDGFDNLLYVLTGDSETLLAGISFGVFTLVIPLFYATVSIKKFLNIKWAWAIPAGAVVVFSVGLVNLVYRFIILRVTLWAT